MAFTFPNDFNLYNIIRGFGIYVTPTNYKNINQITYNSGPSWANGTYYIMSSNFSDTNYPKWAGYIFNKITPNSTNDSFWLGIQSGSTAQTIYYDTANNPSNGLLYYSKIQAPTSALYSTTTGAFTSYNATTMFPVSTTYDTSSVSNGDYFEVKFPFKFIINNLYLSTPNWAYPKMVRIVGSNDGITWFNVVSSNITGLVSDATLNKVITISNNNTGYYNHRFIIESVNGNQGKASVQMCKMDGFVEV